MAALVFTDPQGERHAFTLEAARASVGRHAKNDLVLQDSLVSRQHCLIEKRGADGFALVDLGSSYGTFVNDERVQGARMLVYGDVVRVGNVLLRFVVAADQDDSTAPSFDKVTPAKEATDGGRPPVSEEVAEVRKLVGELRDWIDSLPPAAKPPKELVESLGKRVVRVANAVADLERNRILAQTLAEVGKLIHLISDLDTILKVTLDLAVRALGADRGYILLREKSGMSVRVAQNMGDLRGISSTIAADVVESGQPVVTTDAQIDPRYNRAESIAIHAIRAVMCVPLRNVELQTVGAIYVDGRPGLRLFDERGVGFLSGFAGHAADAIDRAQLAERSRLEEERRERLSRFFSEPVIAEILKSDEAGDHLERASRRITVLFTDIRGFTALLEKLSPEEAVEMLNDYFTELAEEVLAEAGTLDKFTGDGLMAFWNAPQEQPDHARRAVRAALKMQARLPPLLARWKEQARSFARHVAELPTGIGIHTGDAVVGRIGSPKKLEYTAIGDAVNLASRVQGQAAGGEVIVTGATLELVPGAESEALPPSPLKGKSQLVPLHRVKKLG